MSVQPEDTLDKDALGGDLAAMKPTLHPVDFFGLIAALVPFGLSYSRTETSYSTVTATGALEVGTRTTRHMDYVALAGGALALVCAVIGLSLIGRMKAKGIRFAIFAVLLALGGFQIIRGVLVGLDGGSSVSGTILG